MNENVGGLGNRNSNTIWLQYRAMKDQGDGKKPYGKFTRYMGKGVPEEEYSFASGLLQSVKWRLNTQSREFGEFYEMIVTLSAVVNGESWYYNIPFRGDSMAAFSIARRLRELTRGELVEVAAGTSENGAWVSIQPIRNGNKVKLVPIATGVDFQSLEGLVGAKKTAAQNHNASLREDWVKETIQKLPYFDDGSQPATAVQPAEVDEYDPFEDPFSDQ